MLSVRPPAGSPFWWPADFAGRFEGEALDGLRAAALECPLERELLALVEPIGMAALGLIEAMGAERGALAPLCMRGDLGRARVLEEKGRFAFDEAGQPRLILAVRDDWGALIDLVALSSGQNNGGDRARWSLRRGEGWVLGEWDLAAAALEAEIEGRAVLRLYGTAIDWLLGQRAVPRHASSTSSVAARDERGPEVFSCCVLDWGASALSGLRGLGKDVTILCDDPGAAERLRGVLSFGGLPRVASISGAQLAA